MPELDVKPSGGRSIAGPVIAFALLVVVVVVAVVVGNLRVASPNDCRPLNIKSDVGDEAKSWPVLVLSNGDSELLLCDVGAETVKYEPPDENDPKVLLGKSMFRLHTGDEIVLPDSLIGKVEENDLDRSDRGVLVYEKGVFGEVEDCYGDPYDFGDPDQTWAKDQFGVFADPEDIQSCWFKLEFEYLTE